MRVLHVINSLLEAGAEALTKELALEFKRRGVDVSVAILKRLNSSFEGELAQANIPLLRLSSTGIYSPLQVLPLAREIGKYDVVQAVLFPATLHAAAAAALVNDRPRLVTSEQNTTNRRRKSILRPLDQWMYSRFDAIACASRAIEESLVEWLPEIAGRASVIPNAIDLGRFQNAPALARSVIGVPDNVPAIIFVARFEEQKDHETLLRSLVRLNDAHLILAGDGPLRSSVEKLASFLGIRARVHFLGRRPDVPSLLKAADVYVQSSHWEGFGIAAVEAMAAGLPVIASDVPGLADVVRDAGLLVPPGDFAALGEAIRSVLESQGLRHELEKKSRQRAQQFSIQKCASGYLALYEVVLREKPHAN